MSDAITSSAAGDKPKPENMPTDCIRLGILVEEAEYAQSRERFSSGPDVHMRCPGTYKRHIHMAAMSGNWIKASSYDKTHPNWICTPLTGDGDTALHVAVSMEKIDFVVKLVERMSMQEMETRMADGNTAFCMAAISGNVEIAAVLFHKNPGLVWIRGHKEMLPIQLAFLAGHRHMVEFLFKKTQEDLHVNTPFYDIVKLFFLSITNNIYTVASNLLDKYPELATLENENGLTALQVLAQLPFCKDAPGYQEIIRSLFKGMKEEEFLNSARTSKVMFDAGKLGNVMILKFIFNYNPKLLMEVNSKGQSLLHIAILYRQASVYRLILSMGAYKNVILQLVDYDGNNALHLAGKLAAEERFGSPIHQVLIRSEELWFKEVERIVPPALQTMENKDGLTPKKLFYREHKDLSEKAISELNNMANNFLLVATLMATLGITGALTIRTIDTDKVQTPFFLQKTWYIIFLLATAIGLSFCAISMLLHTSVILPSISKPEHNYVSSRLIRIMCGNLILYVSVGTMGTIGVTAGAILVYTFCPTWIFYVIVALCGIPLILSFVIYYYALHLAQRLILAFCEQVAVKMLSRIGIKWAPLYFG